MKTIIAEKPSVAREIARSNNGGAKAFSFLAKTALNNFSAVELDPTALVGKKLIGDIEHSEVESTTKEGEMMKFANLRNFKVYEETPKAKAASTTEDLMSLLS